VIASLTGAGWPARAACMLAGISHATWYRRIPGRPQGVRTPHRQRNYPNRVSQAEAQDFINHLNSEAYGHLSVTQAYWRMLDAGLVFFSKAAAHRIARARGLNTDRRAQRRGTGAQRVKPVVEAQAPNQLWSWDITLLHGPGRHTYRLYTMMDVFSRKVVGHRIEHGEAASFAAALIRDAGTNNQYPSVLHADNGGPMRAATTVQFAQSLGIRLSYSRPRVSNDNPYSEALFKTVKYDLQFPSRFESIEHARAHLDGFFSDYNEHHRHSGLNYYTPNDVHHARAHAARAKRQAHLDLCHANHPERFRTRPLAHGVPERAGINHQQTRPLSQTA
jgi:putative transposase